MYIFSGVLSGVLASLPGSVEAGGWLAPQAGKHQQLRQEVGTKLKN